jgi:ABC-2 type transport system ATP-binding protein
LKLATQLRARPGVHQAVAFGTALHVSGGDAAALEQAIAPFRNGYDWAPIRSGLEDVFIHLMDQSQDNFAKL